LFLFLRHADNNLIVFNSLSVCSNPRDALLALVVLHVVRKAVDVGVPELFARHQVWKAFEDGEHFVGQFVAAVLTGHADLDFCRGRTNQNANPNAKAITSQQIGLNTVPSTSPATIALRAVAWLGPVDIDMPPRIMPTRTQKKR